jgi:hypothetical protein
VASIIDSLNWEQPSMTGTRRRAFLGPDASVVLWEDNFYTILAGMKWSGKVDLLAAECVLREWFPELIPQEEGGDPGKTPQEEEPPEPPPDLTPEVAREDAPR